MYFFNIQCYSRPYILMFSLKSWLKTQHSKTKIMTSGPITSWQYMGKEWKQ